MTLLEGHLQQKRQSERDRICIDRIWRGKTETRALQSCCNYFRTSNEFEIIVVAFRQLKSINIVRFR